MDENTTAIVSAIWPVVVAGLFQLVLWLLNRKKNQADENKANSEASKASSETVKNFQKVVEEMRQNYADITNKYIEAMKKIATLEENVEQLRREKDDLKERNVELENMIDVERLAREKLSDGVQVLIGQLEEMKIQPKWIPE